MRNVPLFLVFTSLFILINGIHIQISPQTVTTNGPWSVTMQSVSNDPTQFQVSLLFNDQPAPGFNAFPLDFTKHNPFIFSSSDRGAPKLQAGLYTIVATPQPPGSGSPQTFPLQVDDPEDSGAAASPQTSTTATHPATDASPTQTLTQATTQTSEPNPSSQSQTNQDATGNGQSSSALDGSSSSMKGSASADGSSPTTSSPGSDASPSEGGGSGEVIGTTTGSDGSLLPVDTLSPSLGSGDGNASPSDSPNSDPSTSGAAGALTASKKNNTGVIAGAVVGVLALLALLVGGLLLYKHKKQKSRPFSFNRDLMVRQRAPSMMSDPSTNLPTTEDGFGYNPYGGYGDEKVRADTETLPIGTQAAAY